MSSWRRRSTWRRALGLSHLHEFNLADGRVIGFPDDDFAPDLVWLDHTKLKIAREVGPGEQFEYVFDVGDNWRHRCVVEREKADPVEEYSAVPDRPVAIWGWGLIPDQYGRRSFDGDRRIDVQLSRSIR